MVPEHWEPPEAPEPWSVALRAPESCRETRSGQSLGDSTKIGMLHVKGGLVTISTTLSYTPRRRPQPNTVVMLRSLSQELLTIATSYHLNQFLASPE